MKQDGVTEETTPEVKDLNEADKKEPETENKENTTDCLNPSHKCENSTGTKSKRKARSTRRRLNAMMNNSSLHFSDTDSEGELSIIHAVTRNPGSIRANQVPVILPQPAVSVMVDGIEWHESENMHQENFYLTKERRNSFVDNLTDVDEIYTSEPEGQEVKKSERYSLSVAFNGYQGETDLEDLSNDEGEEHTPIYVEPRSDILTEFNGETITTKEGDGPFSIEVRNQMIKPTTPEVHSETPDIVVMPTTDSEDMDASDEDDTVDGACGPREDLEDMDVLGASQIVMTNVNKMENLLNVAKDISDDGISDNHTDVEDLE